MSCKFLSIHCLKHYTATKGCKQIREEKVFCELAELITIPPDYKLVV
jgi:hypothetical protein